MSSRGAIGLSGGPIAKGGLKKKKPVKKKK